MIDTLLNLFPRTLPAVDEAGPEDAAAFADLHATAFRRGWSAAEFEQMLAERRVVAHRAMLGRQFGGFILSRIAADEAEILSVAVARARRSRGIGALLLSQHLALLERLGVRAVFLEVDTGNVAARRLYARAGFGPVGERPGYYRSAAGALGHAVVLRRDLG